MERKNSAGRLLLADDHALVREGFRAMLAKEEDIDVIAEAENGREALDLCRELAPDLVLMDVRMPEMDGLEATRRIKGEMPRVSVLVITTHDDPDYLFEAVRAGAAGYVLKGTTKAQLVEAVRKALSGESLLDPEVGMNLLRHLAGEEASRSPSPEPPQRKPPQAPAEEITPRELEVLRQLARGKTNRQISTALHFSEGTVKLHVRHIIRKLGVSDRTQAAVRAMELGLIRSGGE